MGRKNDWKKREGIVYSTDDNFAYSHAGAQEETTLPPQQQQLKVSLDKSGRAGKQVTLVSGFVGSVNDLNELAKLLKAKCGVGGSVKDGAVLIQGEFRDKVVEILIREGYRARRSG
ncbi:MAG TPA: translation initiation factor [Chryseosolibacter sp.]|nr:translation initiation factor [Chryseosolibacter sp.]